MQVTKQQLRDRMVLDHLMGIEDDFEDGTVFGNLLDKQVKQFNPNASPEDLERIKERCRGELKLNRIRRATADAVAARKRLESAQGKLGDKTRWPREQNLTRQAERLISRRGKLSRKYEGIDKMLRQIADAHPRSHEEVFQQLEDRRARLPDARPFSAARGWMAGFRKDPTRARSWLSKRWSALGLSPFPRGPK